jgi:aldose 1-epimerase
MLAAPQNFLSLVLRQKVDFPSGSVRETVRMSSSPKRKASRSTPVALLPAQVETTPNFLTLTAGPAQVIIDLQAGARIASWKVHGLELLEQRTDDNHPFGWGSYAMVPYAGRIRDGKLAFQGKTYELPTNMGDHAIHGIGFDRPWTLLSATNTMAIVGLRFTDPWPFTGTVTHLFQLTNDRLIQQMSVSPTVDQPVTLGWHPWFRRQLEQGSSLQLDVEMSSAQKWTRDASGIPTGKLGPIGERPWDDSFRGVGSIGLRWPGALNIDVTHDCPDVVIYDPEHAICVEPQSGPPNSANMPGGDAVIPAGSALEHTVQWRWTMASRP